MCKFFLLFNNFTWSLPTESGVMIMCDKSNNNTQSTADYLAQLINDRKQVTAFPNVFIHVERLIDEGKSLSISLTLTSS